MAHAVKNMPAMWETQVKSLGQEDPLLPTLVFLPGEFHRQRSHEVANGCTQLSN